MSSYVIEIIRPKIDFSDYESVGREFESLLVHNKIKRLQRLSCNLFFFGVLFVQPLYNLF